MEKSVLDKKWKVSLPFDNDQHWRDVVTLDGNSVCTCFCDDDQERSNEIVRLHNEKIVKP